MTVADKYPLILRVLHWAIALLILSLLVMGLTMDEIPRSDPRHAQIYNLHKSLGVTVLGLALLRIACRIRLSVPPLPDSISRQERILAHLGHFGLYYFMLALPLSGIIMTNSFGFAAPWFGVELPRIVGVDKARGDFARTAHEYMAWGIMGLVGLHIAGAIKHYVSERVNLFKRIL